MNISAELIGFEPIIKRMGELPALTRNRIFKQAAPEAAEFMRAQISAAAPRDSGELMRGVRTSKVKARRGMGLVYIGEFTKGDASDYAWAVETGHMAGETKVPPKPFIRQTFDARNGQFFERIGLALADLLEETLSR